MSENQLPEICVVYPRSRICGGAQAVLAWAIHALQDEWRVHVFTLDVCDPVRWRELYGVDLRGDNILWSSLESENPRISRLLRRIGMVTLDQYVLMRWFSRRYPKGALPFCCHNEMAFPVPGLQYIHFPMLMTGNPRLARLIGQSGSRAKELFGRTLKLLTGVNNRDLSANFSLCNSAFIEGIFHEYYGNDTPTAVVHPPVLSDLAPPRETSDREDGVVMIGRMVPHKRVEDGIRLVELCRRAGFPLELHLVTSGGDAAYMEKIKSMAEREPWIHWHWKLSREELSDLCFRTRFGLHCNPNEHFGMVTAEMVRYGCLVLGHDSGGTREILPSEKQRFSNPEEGARKLADILSSRELGEKILRTQQGVAERFSLEAFQESIREHARKRLGENR